MLNRRLLIFSSLVLVFFLSLGWLRFIDRPSASQTQLSSVTEASMFSSVIQPIFTNRCIACHSCNTAPCQLNLTNYEGVSRGANKAPINQPYSQSSFPLTRLGIDAKSTAGWRALKFFSVTERSLTTASNLEAALRLKDSNPNVPAIRAEKAKTCPADENQWKKFVKDHSDMGMPYGLPALQPQQRAAIQTWIAAGAPGPTVLELKQTRTPSNEKGQQAIRQVESFLNNTSLEQRLVSRYLYEHLFLAHLHFAKEMPNEFFRLVRSRTSCAGGVDEIASRRPYDDPGSPDFSYCLKKVDQQITEKNHIVYEIGDQKLARWKQLFFSKAWAVKQLPTYEARASSNPFLTFAQIPAVARYQWLLDNAQYTVMTFIKGAVCRGGTAVNVIDERFQILFLDPKADHFVQDSEYSKRATQLLRLPGEYGSDVKVIALSPKILPFLRTTLKHQRRDYRALRDQQTAHDRPEGYSLDDIWDGDSVNPNAVLTVFRHFDSAQVLKGAWGGQPKTAWVLDYPLFERIVYDLVAGYDNNGSMSHQVLTRVYMHYIRMEAEENYLSFLPPAIRLPMRDYWYRKAGDVNKRYPLNSGTGHLLPTGVKYRDIGEPSTQLAWHDASAQFFAQVYETRMNARVMGQRDVINNDHDDLTTQTRVTSQAQFESELGQLVSRPASRLPLSKFLDDTAFIRVILGGGQPDAVYTLVRNKEHFNIASILGERGRRDPENDSISVLPGYQASYPNRFFRVDIENASDFIAKLRAVKSQASLQTLIAAYGISRESPEFWANYDWFVRDMRRRDPVEAGAIDLVRYGNAEPLPEDDENDAQ